MDRIPCGALQTDLFGPNVKPQVGHFREVPCRAKPASVSGWAGKPEGLARPAPFQHKGTKKHQEHKGRREALSTNLHRSQIRNGSNVNDIPDNDIDD